MDNEMHAIGMLYAAILAILMVPLLPFVAVVWLVLRLVDGIRSLAGPADEPSELGRGRPPAA
jgi:uncharacterized membrane protein